MVKGEKLLDNGADIYKKIVIPCKEIKVAYHKKKGIWNLGW